MRNRLFLWVAVAVLALVLGFVTFSPTRAVWAVRMFGYWVMLGTTLAFGFYLYRSLSPCWRRERLREWRVPALVIVTATAFMHIHERHELKVVMDEVVLQGTAMGMHHERMAAVTARGFDLGGNYTTLTYYVDKRPLFFPFLLSTVHDLTGYRPQNVFWLNGAATLGLLVLLYLIGRRAWGSWAGISSVLLLTTVPLVAQNATAGGFELVNMGMIALTLWLGMRYAEFPHADRLCAFVLSGVLLAQVRYESVLFVLPVGLSIFFVWWREKRVDLPWPLILSPLLLIIYPLQHNVFKLSQDQWQLEDVAGATQPFGLQYLYENIGHAMNFFLSFDGSQPNSWALAILGTLSVGFFFLIVYRQHREIVARPANAVFCIFILGLLLHTGFMLCYFWGRWDDPLIRRLSLPAHLLLVWALIYAYPQLIAHRRRWPILTFATALYIVAVTAPSSSKHRFSQENFVARTSSWVFDYLAEHGEGKRFLAIDGSGGLVWNLFKQSGFGPDEIAKDPSKYLFQFKHRTFDDYFVVQRCGMNFETGERPPIPSHDLGDAFTLELVREIAFSPVYIVRFSRVVAIDEAKLLEWGRHRRENRPPLTPPNEATSKTNSEGWALWLKNLP